MSEEQTTAQIILFDQTPQLQKCSFCGKVTRTIEGVMKKYICDVCVLKCTELIKESENEITR